MPPIQSKLKSKVIHSQAREIISNVYLFMKREAEAGSAINLKKIGERVAEATGVSESSVRRIIRETKKIDSGASTSFSTPGKQRTKPCTKSGLDGFNEEVVRRTVHNFYITNKERPTVNKVLCKLKDSINFQGSASTLRKILLKLGFRWKKTKQNRQILMEHHSIRAKRLNYLREIQRYRREGRNIVYMDETYIHSSHTTPFAWSDTSLQGLFAPVSKGRRLIIIHAGGEQGFIPNAYVRFKSQQKSGDYHDDMNYTNYEKWLKEKLIPNLPPRSVLIIDNAPYHNVQNEKPPHSRSRRDQMISWLQKHLPENELKKINFSVLRNPEIYQIILPLKPAPSFKIDTLLAQNNHTVLRLPPYHPELNPIELIWATLKKWVASHNVTFKMDDVIELTDRKMELITREEWQEHCRHVRDVELEFMRKEGLLDAGEELIIHLNGDSGDSDSDYEEAEDGEDAGFERQEEDEDDDDAPMGISGVAPLI